jgi:hypothetical protein
MIATLAMIVNSDPPILLPHRPATEVHIVAVDAFDCLENDHFAFQGMET